MEYKLHCFRDSGFSYKVALFLQLAKLSWQPIFVDYFQGDTRSDQFRDNLNLQGECPVLSTSSGLNLSQSAAILQYLADKHDLFLGQDDLDKYQIIRWMSYDNHKFSSQLATHRYHHHVSPGALSDKVHDFIYQKVLSGLSTIDKQLSNSRYIAGTAHLTIADISIVGYLLYPEHEFAFSLSEDYPNIFRLIEEFRNLPEFASPDELMPSSLN